MVLFKGPSLKNVLHSKSMFVHGDVVCCCNHFAMATSSYTFPSQSRTGFFNASKLIGHSTSSDVQTNLSPSMVHSFASALPMTSGGQTLLTSKTKDEKGGSLEVILLQRSVNQNLIVLSENVLKPKFSRSKMFDVNIFVDPEFA